MVAWKWGPALATGNTIVMKPAEQTPLSCLRMAELAIEAGFPPGVINVVTGFGEAGARSSSTRTSTRSPSPESTETAQHIMRDAVSTLKRLTFELGGKSPNIVFADADLDAAIAGAEFGLFFNQGQCCCAGSRLFVEEKIHEKFVAPPRRASEAAAARRPIRSRHDPGTAGRQGPVRQDHGLHRSRQESRRAVRHRRQPRGDDRLLHPADRLRQRHRRHGHRDRRNLRPGPERPPFKDIDEVVERANKTLYGLAAAVWTRDVAKAHRVAKSVRAGTVWINCYDVFDAAAPFGGFKMSGIGRELGEYALANYTEVKTVTMSLK